MVPEEIDLLAKARQGDLDALGRLFERYRERTFRLCCTLLTREEDAHDVVQESYHRAHLSLNSFRGDAAFFTWLSTIAVNACKNRLRSQRSTLNRNTLSLDALESSSLQELPDPQPSVEEQVLGPAQPLVERVLAKAQGRWDKLDHDLFLLHYGEGKTCEEVAQMLHVPASTLRSRKRDHLQSLLEEVGREFRQEKISSRQHEGDPDVSNRVR